MRVHFVQQQKQQLEFESIGFNRAKIEIVCARRDQNCKFTFFIRIEFKGGEAKKKIENTNINVNLIVINSNRVINIEIGGSTIATVNDYRVSESMGEHANKAFVCGRRISNNTHSI